MYQIWCLSLEDFFIQLKICFLRFCVAGICDETSSPQGRNNTYVTQVTALFHIFYKTVLVGLLHTLDLIELFYILKADLDSLGSFANGLLKGQ